MKLFLGYDSSNIGQKLAYQVCKLSIEDQNTTNIPINKLVLEDLKSKQIFFREDDTGSTEFTYTRFLVPYLCNYTGLAIFCDNDFLWFCDPKEIFDQCKDKSKAVFCVKHEYKECKSRKKMNGKEQTWYPRKNWSSLMVFNCSHPSVRNLTIENVNKNSPSWLHRMEWCKDAEIGSLDKKYNYLVGYYEDENYKNLHFTDGGPWYENYKTCQYSNLWLTYLKKLCKKGINYMDFTNATINTFPFNYSTFCLFKEDLCNNIIEILQTNNNMMLKTKLRNRYILNFKGSLLEGFDTCSLRKMKMLKNGDLIINLLEEYRDNIIRMLYNKYQNTIKDGVNYKFSINFTMDEDNYEIGPHTDKPSKKTSLITYLNHQDIDNGMVIYEDMKNRHQNIWKSKHYTFEGFNEIERVKNYPGSSVDFKVTSKSFHGVPKIKCQTQKRYSIQIFFLKLNK